VNNEEPIQEKYENCCRQAKGIISVFFSRPRIFLCLFIILLCFLVGPYLIPIPPLEGVVPPDILADPDSRFVRIDDVKVHYKTAGNGNEALILLHGFRASTITWYGVFAPLAQNYSVVAYDRTGFGYSARPVSGEWGNKNPYSPLSQVEQLIALMDSLGIEQAVLVGSSAGGIIAALTAVYYPERVKALILVAAAIFQGGPPRWLHPVLRIPQVKRLGSLAMRYYYTYFFDEVHKRAWHDPSKRTSEILDGYEKPMKAENWDRALWEYVLAYESLDLAMRLNEIKIPVLIIAGDDDPIVPLRGSEKIAEQISHADLVIMPDSGHLPHEENPELFLSIVKTFLEKNL
jgi:pimeloyl-ACP methyl ester carboxylesterase